MHPYILVSVTAYPVPADSTNWVFGMRKGVIDILNLLHAIPLVVTENTVASVREAMYQQASGVMILGGHDIDPVHYGQQVTPEIKAFEPQRDVMELDLMKRILRDKKPYVGICRGSQILNIACGGTLHADIRALCHTEQHGSGTANSTHNGTLSPTIEIDIIKNTRLHTMLQTLHGRTTCNHHQAVDIVGADLVTSAYSKEGIIEVIEHSDQSHFCFGIESHPEADPENHFAVLFDQFGQAIQQYGTI